jgi:hypothetical protein
MGSLRKLIQMMPDDDLEADEAAPAPRPQAPSRKARTAPGTARRKPKLFSEAAYFTHLKALVDEGAYEEATRYFMESLADLAGSKTNAKEKFNHVLYGARLVQGGGGTKHGYQKLLRKYRSLVSNLGEFWPDARGGFVELGCGAHDPLGLASCMFLNGFEPACGIDLLPPHNPCYSALSMFDTLSNIRSFPRRYCHASTNVGDLVKRLALFDLAAFERGEFGAGFHKIPSRVRFEASDIIDSPVAAGSVSLLTSFAVLEHVTDIDAICRHLFRIMRPEGVIYHFVDLADHRSYRDAARYSPFTFLTEEECPASLNRLRAPQITAAHAAAGFEVLKDLRQAQPLPPADRERLLPQYRAMRIDDVAVVKQHLVLRKPG